MKKGHLFAGQPWRTLLKRLAACTVFLSAFLVGLPQFWAGNARCQSLPETEASARESSSAVRRPDVGFSSKQKWIEHYRKHGKEFGFISKDEYLQRAQELRDRTLDGDVLEAVRSDGVITRFDRRSGAFIAFQPDGVIRTFFRPNAGEAYFWRQQRRQH